MAISLKQKSFDPFFELKSFQQNCQLGQFGAMASFIGSLRDFNEDSTIHSMFLEHYPGMTEQQLANIEQTAKSRWSLIDTLIIHRVGEVHIGEAIVLTACWSAHRAEAFLGCQALIEDLKTKAPFWKQETTDKGKRWVRENTPYKTGD